MADFCKQCSLVELGEDFGDLANLSPGDTNYYVVALCEGCGPIVVNEHGECQSEDCIHEHGKKEKAQEERAGTPEAKD
jgi:hypothetical protein